MLHLLQFPNRYKFGEVDFATMGHLYPRDTVSGEPHSRYGDEATHSNVAWIKSLYRYHITSPFGSAQNACDQHGTETKLNSVMLEL